MGCTCSEDATTTKHIELPDEHLKSVTEANTQISKYISDLHVKILRVKKLLLLGAGSAGKTTLFKQIKCIHGEQFDDGEKAETQRVVRTNCVIGILQLLKQSEELANKTHLMNIIDVDACKVDLEDETILSYIRTILEFSQEQFETGLLEQRFTNEALQSLGVAISSVWKLAAIQQTYAYKQYYSIIENMDFFLDRILSIMDFDYYPTVEDVLKCRIRTTGIVEQVYDAQTDNKPNQQPVKICIFDVGGQRTERKKWIHCFENVTAVIFVAALNHYCSVLFEDESMNAMRESLLLFDEICNSKWFKKTAMILFLNKNDLFEICIRTPIPITFCFGAEYKGANYEPKDDEKEDLDHYLECVDASREYIRTRYLVLNANPNKSVYSHVTTATDKDSIEKVFYDVQNIVIQINLFRGGLI